jgi:hypothetical protein
MDLALPCRRSTFSARPKPAADGARLAAEKLTAVVEVWKMGQDIVHLPEYVPGAAFLSHQRAREMSPHQAVAVGLRLFAVWLGIYGFRTVVSFAYVRDSAVPGFGAAVAFLALTVLLVIALWFFPRSIAGKLLSSDTAKSETSATPDLWLAMGCALLGLWMLTSALPSLLLDTYALLYMDTTSDDTNLERSVLYCAVEVSIALCLVFGAKGFRKMFWWAQHAGYTKD